ncbi:hypothetical protein EDB85DRAFT_2159566 [Lactarius pseudohatsudake]|nr:hypothetical protein EDB85DRAFT_2159566 [Lactarius pseudohatsudake]
MSASRAALNNFNHKWGEVSPHYYTLSRLDDQQSFVLLGESLEPPVDPIVHAREAECTAALISSCITIHAFDNPNDPFRVSDSVANVAAHTYPVHFFKSAKQDDVWNMLVELQNNSPLLTVPLHA